MKKYISLCLALLSFTACQYKEDPVFEQKPTERTLSVLGKYKEIMDIGFLPTILKNIEMVFGYILIILQFFPLLMIILSTTVL